MQRTIRQQIKLYGTLLGLSEAECEQMASGGSARAKRECMRTLRRRYREENAVPQAQRRPPEEQIEFWRDAAPASTRFIYFIQAGARGPVKIGIANDPEKRRRDLQSGNHRDLRIQHVVPGDLQLEKQLHHRFREARIRGEWFGLAYLEVILLFAEGLAAEHIDCYQRQHSMPVLVGGRVMSLKQRREMQLDLRRLLDRYGREGLTREPRYNDVLRIMDQTWGMAPEEVRAEAAVVDGKRADFYQPWWYELAG